MDVIVAERDGSPMNALRITRTIPFGPISISFPHHADAVSIYVSGSDIRANGYRGEDLMGTVNVNAGEQTILLKDEKGFDAVILITNGELTIFEIVLGETTEGVGDITYVSFHHKQNSRHAIEVPDLQRPEVSASRTGVDELGNLRENQSSISLRWRLPIAGTDFLRPARRFCTT